MKETPLQPRANPTFGGQKANAWVYPSLYAPPLREKDDAVLHYGFHSLPGWQIGWAQAIGQRHRISEDSMALRWFNPHDTTCATGLVAALGDGVGGGARGEVASNAIVRHCIECVVHDKSDVGAAENHLVQCLLQGDAAVNQALCQVTTAPGASTLAAVWLGADGDGWVTRVGDARAYAFGRQLQSAHGASAQLRQLLQDQTYRFFSEEPPHPGQEDAPARMVGAGLSGQPELLPVQLRSADTLLLCSDGLHNWVTSQEITQVLATVQDQDEAAHQLSIMALANGSDDDISVLLIKKS